MEELLQWVFLSGSDASVTQNEDGEITADRPETEEKFRAIFRETGLRSFSGVVLKDEEGKLGVLAFESKEPLAFDEETQGPAVDPGEPGDRVGSQRAALPAGPARRIPEAVLIERRQILGIPVRRRRAWAIGALVVAVALVIVPWPLRIEGPVRVLPGSRAVVTACVDGVVRRSTTARATASGPAR